MYQCGLWFLKHLYSINLVAETLQRGSGWGVSNEQLAGMGEKGSSKRNKKRERLRVIKNL